MLLNQQQTVELQEIEVGILRDFIYVCEQLNIKYYLIGGTLLGAVRHKGFIPWDDDIDVGLMRDDYERFLKEAGELLPEHLFLQTYETDSEYPQVFAKIRDKNTAFIETSVKDNKMNHGIFIDIFPLDRCNIDKRKSFSFTLKQKIYTMRAGSLMKNHKLDFRRSLIRQVCKLICPSPHKAQIKLDKLFRSMPDGDCIINFSGIYGDRELMPEGWYGDGVFLEFENLQVRVPKEYTKWLSQVYGNYMELPPEEKRVTHHLNDVIDTKSSYTNYIKQ